MSDQGVRAWSKDLRDGKVEREPGMLPPHHPQCFGCGPESAWGMHVAGRLDGPDVVATYTFGTEYTGAPGIAHGGTVATVVDEVCGMFVFVARQPAVTRKLEVEYLKPVLIGVPYEIRAVLDRHEGRKLFVSCTGTNPDGVVTFRGAGLFLTVGLEHFDQAQGTPFAP